VVLALKRSTLRHEWLSLNGRRIMPTYHGPDRRGVPCHAGSRDAVFESVREVWMNVYE
jgi:hypothetical protein